jgi:hypothetical protein
MYLKLISCVHLCVGLQYGNTVFLILPSSSFIAYFPNNTVANFRVKLVETIVLPGQWEVALTELRYPHTWSTLRRGVQQTFLYKIGSSPYQTVVLKETQYSSIEQLTKAVNAGKSNETQTKVKLNYNRNSRKVLVDMKHGTTVWFTGELATVLGFDQDILIEKKLRVPMLQISMVDFPPCMSTLLSLMHSLCAM